MMKAVAKVGRMRRLRRAWRRQAGQAILEYTLVLAVFGIPMIWVATKLLGALGGYYEMVSFLVTSPLP